MKITEEFQRYFLAIVPPEPILSEAQAWKEHFKEVYNSKASFNSPPHITLHMPFRWKAKKEKLLTDTLTSFASSVKPFDLELKDFGAFPPRVVFLNVVDNNDLITLQKNLERFCKKEFQLFNANRLDQPYHPHLTLAFRDLKEEMYTKAWEEFSEKKYRQSFLCNSICILKHDGVKWRVFFYAKLKFKL
jgi:2'-5' RNA ligase